MATATGYANVVMYFKFPDSWVRFERDGSGLSKLNGDRVSEELVGYGFRDMAPGRLDKLPETSILQLVNYPVISVRHLFLVG